MAVLGCRSLVLVATILNNNNNNNRPPAWIPWSYQDGKQVIYNWWPNFYLADRYDLL